MWAAGFRTRCRDYADAFAEQWIGFAFPPVQRAIADAKWSPDPPSDYCQLCGDSVAEGEATESGCSTCRPGAELAGGIGDGVLRLGTYTDDLLYWVKAIKFGRWTEMGEELGRLLGQCVRDSGVVDPARTIIVPMPTPIVRRIYRGIDHTRVIASGAARELRAPIVSILARGNHQPQVTLPASVRKRRGSHGLRIRPRWMWDSWLEIIRTMRQKPSRRGGPLRGLHVVLIDDVRTTGATLKAATRLVRTLKPEKIVCAVLAVSDSKARRKRKEQAGDILRQANSIGDRHKEAAK